jgi:hypothetical protein
MDQMPPSNPVTRFRTVVTRPVRSSIAILQIVKFADNVVLRDQNNNTSSRDLIEENLQIYVD